MGRPEGRVGTERARKGHPGARNGVGLARQCSRSGVVRRRQCSNVQCRAGQTVLKCSVSCGDDMSGWHDSARGCAASGWPGEGWGAPQGLFTMYCNHPLYARCISYPGTIWTILSPVPARLTGAGFAWRKAGLTGGTEGQYAHCARAKGQGEEGWRGRCPNEAPFHIGDGACHASAREAHEYRKARRRLPCPGHESWGGRRGMRDQPGCAQAGIGTSPL